MAWVFAFVVALARDFVVARYTQEVAAGNTKLACLYSAACPVLDLCSISVWLSDWQTIMPTAAGYAAGTWLGMEIKKWKQAKSSRAS
jgi:hypothetical protein